MSANNGSMVVAALVLTLGFLTTSAVGGTAIHHPRGRHAERTTLFPSYHEARHDVAHHAGYAGAHASANFFAPGYVFVPGHGILGEDCDMPTSTCPNEVRDTQ
jgi:hypothetical protein